eukprot:scaffold3993_cov146-Skeletonema_marinoi.AAC.5
MLVVQQASSAEWRRRRTRGGMVKEYWVELASAADTSRSEAHFCLGRSDTQMPLFVVSSEFTVLRP